MNKEFMFINLKEIKSYFDYYTFLKIYTKNSLDSQKIKYDRDKKEYLYKDNLKKIFPFWKINDRDKSYNNLSFKDFPLSWLKNQKKVWEIDKELIPPNKIDITSHIPNTFAIKSNFKLTAPYYSSDDDDFYIINNPCLKESVFKVPMVRGSSWKGALLNAGIEILKNTDDFKQLGSLFRIFGTGNNEYRNLFDENDKVIETKILTFLAFEFGVDLTKNVKEILAAYFKTKAQKGRAIFYPTYFDKLSIELINPHNRKTKAGTIPIHYEVVPEGKTGTLQIIYIPFDAVTEKDETVKEQANQDLEFLKECIHKVSENGIGAKTKLGWGKFDINGEIKPIWSEK